MNTLIGFRFVDGKKMDTLKFTKLWILCEADRESLIRLILFVAEKEYIFLRNVAVSEGIN